MDKIFLSKFIVHYTDFWPQILQLSAPAYQPGLTHTTTNLAGGVEVCDFRFKKGGPTVVAVPVALEDVVDQCE